MLIKTVFFDKKQNRPYIRCINGARIYGSISDYLYFLDNLFEDYEVDSIDELVFILEKYWSKNKKHHNNDDV